MKAKKSLGQNFLKSALALRKIILAGEVTSDDTILEIGPGKGALTAKLLESAGRVIAVEKDRELYPFLEEKFASYIESDKLLLINGDILEFEIGELLEDLFKTKRISSKNYKIIANIPYNITGAILKKFLANTPNISPDKMVLMVQNEVAKRILARDGKESLLSVSVKAYGEPKMIMKVPAEYFSPAPKVDSAIIAINNISKKYFTENQVNEEDFWAMVKAGFAHKRKKLSGNFKNLAKNLFSEEVLKELGNKRAEDCSLDDWANILRKKNS